MTFPAMVPLGAFRIHPHYVFDLLAYSGGFRLFLLQRRRFGDTIDTRARWSVVAAAILGAAIGSKIFFWLEDPRETLAHWNDLAFLLGGKTIVGALIGGLVAVEMEKRWSGLTRPHRRSVRAAARRRDRYRAHRLLPVGPSRSHVRHAVDSPLGRGLRRRDPASSDAAL